MKEGFEMPKPARVERAEPREKPEETKPPEMSRRAFTRGLLQSAIAAALASSAADKLAAAPGYEHINLSDTDLAFFETLLKDPEALQRFQRLPALTEVISFMRVLARSETGFAEKVRQSDAVHLGALLLGDRDNMFRGNGTRIRVRVGDTDGIPHFKYFIVSAKHVADLVPAPGGGEWVGHPDGYDIAVSEVHEHTVPWKKDQRGDYEVQDVLDFDMSLHDPSEIDGKPGVVLGHNRRNDGYVRHAYASRVSPQLTPEFYDSLMVNRRGAHTRDLFRVIVLPPGEATYDKTTGARAQGASGSALIMEGSQPGTMELGGVIVACVEQRVGGVSYSIAEIVDREFVRETIEAALKLPRGVARFAEPKLKR